MRFPFERLVVWGGRSSLQSHAYIHRHFHRAARRLGIPSAWLEDDPRSRDAVVPGALVLAANIWSQAIAPATPGAFYVLHNFDGSHPLCRELEDEPERLVRLQVWTNGAVGERWGAARSFARAERTLFQPWGTDLLADEFLDPVGHRRRDEAVFVGAIWSDKVDGVELGNAAAMQELRASVERRGLSFRHLTEVSDADNVRAVREARLAPAIAGAWQVEHDYLPCRAFKNVSYGQVGITNVPALQDLLQLRDRRGGSIDELIGEALELSEEALRERVREQQHIVAGYTYKESLESFVRAFEEIA